MADKGDKGDKGDRRHSFKFRKEPQFLKYFRIPVNGQVGAKHVKMVDIVKEMKLGGFRIGNIFASFWFGVMLFSLQSYFLRQNLQRDTQFISD
jgi:hypothetical protein